MSITREQFDMQCVKFMKECGAIGDTWRLLGESHGSISDIGALSDNDNSVTLMLTKIELKRINQGLGQVQSHEYNVVYSDSFEVPVMYFTISQQDGSPLGYEEILSTLITIPAGELNQVVHQVEHPILFRPFFMIHPCKTKQFMEPHKQLSPNYYLICWLTTVGSIVGLELDSHFAVLDKN